MLDGLNSEFTHETESRAEEDTYDGAVHSQCAKGARRFEKLALLLEREVIHP